MEYELLSTHMEARLAIIVGEYMQQPLLPVPTTHPYLGVGVIQNKPGRIRPSTGRDKLIDALFSAEFLCAGVLHVPAVLQHRREIFDITFPHLPTLPPVTQTLLFVLRRYPAHAGAGYGVDITQSHVGPQSLKLLCCHPLPDLRHPRAVVGVVLPAESHQLLQEDQRSSLPALEQRAMTVSYLRVPLEWWVDIAEWRTE